MSNKYWEYHCSENVGSSIRFYPLYGGEMAIEAKYTPENMTQELKFKFDDFMTFIPMLEKALEEMDEGIFDYYSGRIVVNKISPICGNKGWFQVLPIDEDAICLQLFSQDTMHEISIVLDKGQAEQFMNIAKNVNRQLAA